MNTNINTNHKNINIFQTKNILLFLEKKDIYLIRDKRVNSTIQYVHYEDKFMILTKDVFNRICKTLSEYDEECANKASYIRNYLQQDIIDVSELIDLKEGEGEGEEYSTNYILPLITKELKWIKNNFVTSTHTMSKAEIINTIKANYPNSILCNRAIKMFLAKLKFKQTTIRHEIVFFVEYKADFMKNFNKRFESFFEYA